MGYFFKRQKRITITNAFQKITKEPNRKPNIGVKSVNFMIDQ